MNDLLDDAIRSVTADIVATTPDTSAMPAPTLRPPTPNDRGLWLAAAAAVMVIAGVVGLIAIVGRPTDTTPATVPTVAPPPAADPDVTLLSTVDEIGVDDWVIPTGRPENESFQYAHDNRFGSFDGEAADLGFRSLLWGTDPEVHITIGSTNPSNGVLLEMGAEGTEWTDIDVDGAEWTVDDSDHWRARRTIGDQFVEIAGEVEAAQRRTLLAGLAVVPSEALPFPPLHTEHLVDSETPPAAVHTVGENTLRLWADGQNGYYCTSFADDDGSGGAGCAQRFDPAVSWATAPSGGVGYRDGADVVSVQAEGIVAPDVALIEVDFINDTTVTVTPTDLTGTFDVRFWIAGAEVPLEDGQDPERIGSAVVAVRGLGADGTLLFSDDSPTDSALIDRSTPD